MRIYVYPISSIVVALLASEYLGLRLVGREDVGPLLFISGPDAASEPRIAPAVLLDRAEEYVAAVEDEDRVLIVVIMLYATGRAFGIMVRLV